MFYSRYFFSDKFDKVFDFFYFFWWLWISIYVIESSINSFVEIFEYYRFRKYKDVMLYIYIVFVKLLNIYMDIIYL